MTGNALVAVTVNGRPPRLRIEPSMPGAALVAPALAHELGLNVGKPGFFSSGVCYRFGRKATCGRSEVVRFGWAGAKAEKQRIAWMSRRYMPAADGTIGPGALPESVVSFALHAARAGEQAVALPMHGGGPSANGRCSRG